jgi:hypothetical protein
MIYRLWTRYEPCKICVKVRTSSPQVIALKAYDADKPNTYFMERTKTINGTEDLYVRMPLAPNSCLMSIYNEKNGNLKKNEDPSFEVLSIKKEELEITLPKTKMDTQLVRNFVAFAQKFSFSAGWVAANRDYVSSVGNFKIEYLPYIVSSRGERMATPARVSTKNGRIQVSQEAFKPFTIPMRMAILLHEFSHYYVNSDIANETEADLNGLTIYLGLGYPIKEAYTAFGETFIGYPSEQNKQRYDIINKFIRDYVAEYNIQDVYATGN